MSATRKLIVGMSWVVWFVALAATPFFLAAPYRGPVLTGFYAWVAFGLLVGCLLGTAWGSSAMSVLRERTGKALGTHRCARVVVAALFLVGWLLAIALSTAELVGLPLVLEGDPETIYEATPFHTHEEACSLPFPASFIFDTPWRLLVEEYGKTCLFVSALLCSFAPCLIGARKQATRQWVWRNDSAGSAALSPIVFALSCAAGFLKVPLEFFAFHREVWAFSFGQAPYREGVWFHFGLSPLALLPGVAALLLATVWCFGSSKRACQRCGDAVGDGEKRGISLFLHWGKTSRVLAVYSFGIIVWNFLSRSVLVYGKTPSWGWPLLSALCVIAVLGLAVEGCVSRREPKDLRDETKRSSTGDGPARNVRGPEALESVSAVELYEAFGESKTMTLTEREQQALGLMLAGATSSQSAAKMDIGASTVRAYLQRAYRKLGLNNGEEALGIYRSYREARSCAKAQAQREAVEATPGMSSVPRAILNFACALGLIAGAWALTPIGVSNDAAVVAGPPLMFGLGTGFMLFGLAEWCGAESMARRKTTRMLMAAGIALWVALALLRCAVNAGAPRGVAEESMFFTALGASFAFGAAAKRVVASKDCGNVDAGGYRLAASPAVSVWLIATALFVGFFIQMAWTDLDRPVAATLLVASWTILVALLLVGRLMGLRRASTVALLATGSIATAMGWGSFAIPALTLLSLAMLAASAPLLPSRLGPMLSALGTGLAFGRIATNFCNDLMDYYTWVFDNLDPSDVLFPMIGFAAAMVSLVVIAYVEVKLYREVKSEYDLYRTSRLFGESELARAKAYLVAIGCSPTQVSVGVGVLQGHSVVRIAAEAYLSIGAVNSACMMLYRKLDVNSKAQFADSIKKSLGLGNQASFCVDDACHQALHKP